jgi:hypothetical protein
MDYLLGLFFIRPNDCQTLKSRLEAERLVFIPEGDSTSDSADAERKETASDGEKSDKAAAGKKHADYVKHYTELLQVNHQRVSASISHVSIMSGILIYSTKFVFEPNSWSIAIVQIELCVYLLILMALLRCLRDFGLDRDYKALEYAAAMMDELGFRYGILRATNFILISGTFLFVVLFAIHAVSHLTTWWPW